MNRICIIKRESYIKARVIRIKTTEEGCIEETIRMANNGFSSKLASHARIADGYQMFINSDVDGKMICDKLLDALLCLNNGNVVIERINC
jgi:hypothetical protein